MLCIPASSASSERLFSIAGRTITDARNRLDSSMARNLIYLRQNWDPNTCRYPATASNVNLKKRAFEVVNIDDSQ
jgi:hypothetical protein